MDDDQAHVTFKDVNWIQMYGLNLNNALDYFSTSQFYDRTCNNEVLKMQTKFNNLEQLNMELCRMVGMEYSLVHVQEPVLYVIRKQQRLDPQTVIPVESFYILEGSIFKSPNLYNVITSRMSACVNKLQSVLTEAREQLVYTPETSYTWKHPSTNDVIHTRLEKDPIHALIFQGFDKILDRQSLLQ